MLSFFLLLLFIFYFFSLIIIIISIFWSRIYFFLIYVLLNMFRDEITNKIMTYKKNNEQKIQVFNSIFIYIFIIVKKFRFFNWIQQIIGGNSPSSSPDSVLQSSDRPVHFALIVLHPLWCLSIGFHRLEHTSLDHALEVTLLVIGPLIYLITNIPS